MTEELRDQIASLRTLAPRMNKSTDEAAKTITEVEAFLIDLGVGVEADVLVRDKIAKDEDGVNVERRTLLRYGRWAERFRFTVVVETYDKDSYGHYNDLREDDDGCVWSSCPRGLKLESFAKLPELLAEIASRVKALSLQAEETTAKVRAAIAPAISDDPVVAMHQGAQRAKDGRGLAARVLGDNSTAADAIKSSTPAWDAVKQAREADQLAGMTSIKDGLKKLGIPSGGGSPQAIPPRRIVPPKPRD